MGELVGFRGEVWVGGGRCLTGPEGLGEQTCSWRELKMPMTAQAMNSCKLNHGVLKVRPTGPRLGDREASKLASKVGSIMRDRGRTVKRLEVDLAEVYTMSITALGMCLEFERMAKTRKVQLVLHDVSEPIREVLRLLRLDRLLGGTPRPRPWSIRRRRVA